MNRNNVWNSVLQLLAELGDLIVKYAAQPAYAIASLLIARLYFHATQLASAGAPL